MAVETLVFGVHTALLVVASLLIIYPVLSHAHNVAYTRELQLLAASFVLLAGAYVWSIVVGNPVLSSAFDLLSALTAFTAMWRLATRMESGDDGDDDLTFDASSEPVEGGFRGGD